MKIILFVLIISSFLFAEESYPDYYNRVIKPTVIYSARRHRQRHLNNKLLNGEFGINISYNYLFASRFNDVDPSAGFGFSYRKHFSRFDNLLFNIYYNEYKGKLGNVSIKNKLYMSDLMYLFKPPLWSLPVYIGGGIGFVYNQPDIPFIKSDKSGLFAVISSAYKVSDKLSIFLNLSKSSLKKNDFKENITCGLNYFFY